jgi:hypothetical protein
MNTVIDKLGPSSAPSIEDYLKLLLAFQALPDTTRSRTFMEISGYLYPATFAIS